MPHPRKRPANQRVSPRSGEPDELQLLKRLRSFAEQHRDGRDADKLLHSALRMSLELFQAPAGCVVVRAPGRAEVEPLFSVPKGADWDLPRFAGFLSGEEVEVPQDEMYARIRRNGRMWGLLVVHSPGREFVWDTRRALSLVGHSTTQLLENVDQERIREVRSRIDRKILEQLRPKDLFYQILHGLRSLTGYDHSAALLICDNELRSLQVVAEQIAWSRTKSQRIGLKLSLSETLRERLETGACCGFDRYDGDWRAWTECGSDELAELLDYNLAEGLDFPESLESAMLCAPLATRHGLLGVIKVAALRPQTFGRYEADLIARFLPQAAVALQNLQRTESLESQVLAAERKHAMAELARGVSHDVNNALGGVLPLVQQLQADVEDGEFDRQMLLEDLERIERSLQVCRRIFGGMLNFARGAGRAAEPISLPQEIDCTLSILRESLHRRKIRLELEISSTLPSVHGVRADVEQLLLNLFSNARDAMEDGGVLAVRGLVSEHGIEIHIKDTGCGIPASHLAKIQEPFFTTKNSGSGLGLAICRSIISELGGSMQFESQVGEGTLVRLLFPERMAHPV